MNQESRLPPGSDFRRWVWITIAPFVTISISKLALENGINANLLFKWRQQWREGKLLLPSSESPQLLPVTLDAAAEQPESLAEDPETLSISCEVTFRHGTLRFNGNVSEKLL
ncbi:TPA: transposase, partial [Escherichia coli]|nr:transposase [Escherichia coli]